MERRGGANPNVSRHEGARPQTVLSEREWQRTRRGRKGPTIRWMGAITSSPLVYPLLELNSSLVNSTT